MMNQVLHRIWQRIEDCLQENIPSAWEGLNPPATEEAIIALEQALNIRLPDDVRDSYLRHNGQDSQAPWIFAGWEWHSIERIQEEWTSWNEVLEDGAIDDIENDGDGQIFRKDWWHPKWIPLTSDPGGGNHQCLDLAPGPQGTMGQIITMWHDDADRRLLANSFTDFLEQFANGLEAGEYIYSEEYNAIVTLDEI
ncbi:SMI1/KNR4 family protein [Alkalinema sp. FACHB-956]|uniref:SMI1/KNR4 family protein n=1 Tax=Alkalinema sp. FACHB-956 TaxID=2692768 RepID=UPI001687892B|nr:SMI1/KNR4 family protein [Alkalinema sp. FACHB-956]MBD2328788.1 SMI1/KNR4 family protein [Alkalinema sp. FACHB-956]